MIWEDHLFGRLAPPGAPEESASHHFVRHAPLHVSRCIPNPGEHPAAPNSDIRIQRKSRKTNPWSYICSGRRCWPSVLRGYYSSRTYGGLLCESLLFELKQCAVTALRIIILRAEAVCSSCSTSYKCFGFVLCGWIVGAL